MAGKKEEQTNPGADQSGLLDPDGNEVVGGHNTDTGLDDPGDGPGTQPDIGVPDAGGGTAGPPELDDPKIDYTIPKVGGSPGMDNTAKPDALLVPETETGYKAAQRKVTDDELAASQLTKLLDSNSKYMRQARQEGLEYGGGLGGTSGIRAATGEAIRRGMPIAIADAQAYRDAAAQNMDALNQFGLANIQRQTQLELGTMDANTRLQTTYMSVLSQENIAKMQDITMREIANADNATKMKITAINGQIQKALAKAEFEYSQVLNDQLHANGLEDIALQGEYNIATEERRIQAAEQTTYVNAYMALYDGALDRLAALNGLDIDDAAIQRATDAIWEGFYGANDLLQILYPNATPIDFEGDDG
jgi:hypothetical protein